MKIKLVGYYSRMALVQSAAGHLAPGLCAELMRGGRITWMQTLQPLGRGESGIPRDCFAFKMCRKTGLLRLRQVDWEFKTSLGYMARLCPQTNNNIDYQHRK